MAVVAVSSAALVVNFGGLLPLVANVSISVGEPSSETPAPSWGVNVASVHPFNASDARLVAATSTRYLRFPSGKYTEWMNWTSGVLTEPDGTRVGATTSLATFVDSCEDIGCEAILSLPAEIDSPATAAYDVAYTEHDLRFTPAYWEIGNEPTTWTHFGQPWSEWATPGPEVTPEQYAGLVQQYIAAIRQVDPGTPILGLAAAEQGNPTAWIPPLLALDGRSLAGISIHAYPAVPTPVIVNPIRYFSSLAYGPDALPTVLPVYLSTIAASCPGCSLQLFMTETGTSPAGSGAYESYDSTFEGALYEAAEVTQLLGQKVANVDWFTFQGGYAGAWLTTTGQPTPTFEFFSRIFPQLGVEYIPTHVAGYAGVYAAGTMDGPHGYALLVVNTNVATYVTFGLEQAGFTSSTVSSLYWPVGTEVPAERNFIGSALLAPLSVALLYQAPLPVSHAPGPVLSVSLVGFQNPGILVSLGGVTAGLGAATLLVGPSYRRVLGGAAGVLGIVLLLLVV